MCVTYLRDARLDGRQAALNVLVVEREGPDLGEALDPVARGVLGRGGGILGVGVLPERGLADG